MTTFWLKKFFVFEKIDKEACVKPLCLLIVQLYVT